MRRSDREITDKNEIERIIKSAHVCRLAMVDNGSPYIVPLNFGYHNGTFYFHSAGEGRKIGLLATGQTVCIEIDCDHELVTAENPCEWGMRYASVIAFGKPRFITDPTAKREALAIIMAQYAPDMEFDFPENAVTATTVFAVVVESVSAKRKG